MSSFGIQSSTIGNQSDRNGKPCKNKPVAKKHKSKVGKALRTGRPPLLSSQATSTTSHKSTTSQPTRISKVGPTPAKQSSKVTKALINAHHDLHKSRAKAVAAKNSDLVEQIDEQIAQLGGLSAYQHASLTGQSADRGGDSSVLLVKWLEELTQAAQIDSRTNANASTGKDNEGPRLRVLEVGALSSRNAISRAIGRRQVLANADPTHSPNSNDQKQDIQPRKWTLIDSVRRIDLHSQEPDTIEEIDFMQLPIPLEKEKFHVLSLSLVLNYVPDARGRGEMLKRTRAFLLSKHHGNRGATASMHDEACLPCLFVVLPLPCLTNSRYLDTNRFHELMAAIGYSSLRVHQSAKLHYELFRWDGTTSVKRGFKKIEVNSGRGRNNFCIVLDDTIT